MAYSGEGFDLSFIAAEDLSGDQYHFVVLGSDTTVRRPDSGSEWPVGILQNNPASGEEAIVRVGGISKLVAGAGGLARGGRIKAEYVGATDAGKGLATTTAADLVRATCIMAAGAEDDIATVLMSNFIYAIN